MRTRPRSFVRALGGLLAAVLVAVSCGGSDDDADDDDGGDASTTVASQPPSGSAVSSAPADQGDPVKGGSLTYVAQVEAASLDPVGIAFNLMTTGDGIRATAIYDALIYELQGTGELEFQLAEDLTSTDFRTWTMTLREGVEFSDGTPYDAEAVKFNWERHQDPANASRVGAVAGLLETITVVDETTLEITLGEPNSQFPRLVARFLSSIGSPTAIEELGDGFSTAPVGAGPFVVDEWVRDSRLTLSRNETYWNAPMPYLDEVVIQIIPDSAQRVSTFESGAVHISQGGTGADGRRLEETGANVQWNQWGGGQSLTFNAAAAPFDDVRMRRAVAHAIDMELLNDTINEGSVELDEGLFGRSDLGDPSWPGYPAHDPAEAQRLIDEYVAEVGGPVRFELSFPDVTRAVGEAILTQLQGYENLEVELAITNATAWLQSRGEGDFDAIMVINQFLDPEPDLFDGFHSAGTKNFGRYENAELDAALEAGRSTDDPAARTDAYATVNEILVTEVPAAFYLPVSIHNVYSDDVHGYEAIGDVVPRLDRIWLAP